MPRALVVALVVACAAAQHATTTEKAAAAAPVLVTGAAGRTGSLVYRGLKAAGAEVRALVRDASKAREALGCDKCDESEGVFVGDVTKPATLTAAFHGVRRLAIVVGAGPTDNSTVQRAIEFDGVRNQVRALAAPDGPRPAAEDVRVVLCSSMGTVAPPTMNPLGDILFYKLNAEAFVSASGMRHAIIKPCGLLNTAGNATLLVGHDDTLLSTRPPVIARSDVAAVAVAALAYDGASALRFDLCSKRGPPPADLHAVIADHTDLN